MRNVESRFVSALSDLYDADEAKQLARICLQKVLDCNLGYLLCHSPLSLSETQSAQVDSFLSRLKSGEPVQYVEGEAVFMGRMFNVEPGVLIPRPETVELVQWIVEDCREKQPSSLLDVGTGSGCIAVSLAAELPHVRVAAVDVSSVALRVAKSNAERMNVQISVDSLDVLHTSFEAYAPLDVVVSNPPYICEMEKEQMHKNVLEYEPHLALFVPDNDPLLFYRRIAELSLSALKPKGMLYFEINERFGTEIKEMLEKMGFADVQVRKDFFAKDRMVRATKNG